MHRLACTPHACCRLGVPIYQLSMFVASSMCPLLSVHSRHDMFSARLQFAIFAAPQDRAYHLHRTFPPSAGSEVSARRLCAPP